MEKHNLDRSSKTIAKGMHYFTNVFQLLMLIAVLRLGTAVADILSHDPDKKVEAIMEFVAAGGYAIVALGFHYLRRLFQAVSDVIEELRSTV